MFLSDGFTHGFPLHFQGIQESSHAKNLLSAVQNPTVDAKIAKELAAGRLAGPFDSPPISPFVVSPLGVVPKKSPGEFRLIHHLSFPKGASVNDGISHENSTVCYATIGDAIRCIKLAGQGSYLAKTDTQNAFQIIPIQSDDYGLLGMHWQGSFYFDRCMPMGCARVGEITFSATTPPPIQIHQLTKLVNDAHEVIGFKIKFLTFKHSYNQPPFYLVISPQSTFCPVKILLQFLSARGDSQGALFIQDDGSPASRSWFGAQLSSAIKLCSLNPSVYKGHSFRIGAAYHAAERGMSDAQIRILGRWKSNAFLKYIRVSSLSS